MVVIRDMNEKCKDAARMRREKERLEFVELSKLLPLPSSTTSQLDKASIIRLTSSYLRLRSAFPQGLGENWGTNKQRFARRNEFYAPPRADLDINEQQALPTPGPPSASTSQIKELGSLLLQTLDGFVFALHRDGKIMYISETASVHLGLPQIDLTGSSVFEYIHPADHNDIMNILNLTEAERLELTKTGGAAHNHYANLESGASEEETIELGRSFCMRMKCVLPKRNAGLVSNGYKAIHCSGYLKVRCRTKSASITSSSNSLKCSKFSHCEGQHGDRRAWESYALVAVGHSLLPTASTEIKLNARTFMFRANLDLSLYYIESPIPNLLGYQQNELIGHSLYQFVHIADLSHLEAAHKQVLDKGQVVSRYHRLMRRNGGFIWIQMHATLINNPRSMPKPQHIVGICCVLGESQFDESRSMLLADESVTVKAQFVGATKAASIGMPRKLAEKSTALVKRLNSPIKSVTKLTGIKLASRQINKRNRSKESAMLSQQCDKFKPMRSLMASNRHEVLKQFSQEHSQLANNENSLQTYHSIGSTRRSSADTCSVVSSIASTTSASSRYGGYCGQSKTSGSITSSPPVELGPVSDHYAAPTVGVHNQVEQHFQRQGAYGERYSSQLIRNPTSSYESHDYFQAHGTHYEHTTLPISVDNSCTRQHLSSCWPSTVANSPSLRTPTQSVCHVSSDDFQITGCTLPPRLRPTGEHYYYTRLDEQHQLQFVGESYGHVQEEQCAQIYSSDAQLYRDYMGRDGNLPMSMSCDEQHLQSYCYTAHHGTTTYLSGNSSA